MNSQTWCGAESPSSTPCENVSTFFGGAIGISYSVDETEVFETVGNCKQYRSSKIAKDKSVKRVWLDGGQLFSSPAKGTEKLSAHGRAEVDKAMADFVPDLPNRPIVVEGYSERGSPDERFRRSEQHALALQRYLQTRFKLAANLVGAIPLGDTPPDSTGKQQWDGVALVLLP